MSAVLLNERGMPEPSPEVQRRLRAIHPDLSLRYVLSAPSAWAVALTWGENDRRREMVRKGELPLDATYDIIGYLPMDASPDEAPAYLSRMFRQFPREDVKGIADHVIDFNAIEPVEKAVRQAAAEVLDSSNPAGTPKKRRR
jgi:hypothetical protein